MTAEQASFLLQSQLGTLKNESRTTKAVLTAVPADRADYRPDSIAKPAIELVRHIANADNFFIEAILNGVFAPKNLVPETARTPQEVAAWYEERHAANFAALCKATPDQLLKSLDFRGIFQRPAVMYVAMGLHHTIHHRGQLTSYLRSMGSKVPAIYGESYDSAEAKKAARA